MPKFLEDKLANEARAKGLKGKRAAGYVFGTMNNVGAMHGNKITEKGREMERKHEEDTMAKHEPMREMRIEIHREKGKKVTGFTVHHHMVHKPSKSPAFYEDTTSSHPFAADDHEAMIAHVNKHLKGQTGSGDNEAMEGAEKAEEEEAEA